MQAALRLLVSAGADVNAANVDGDIPLMFCATGETMRTLLELGADPSIAANDGYTALHSAVVSKNVKLA